MLPMPDTIVVVDDDSVCLRRTKLVLDRAGIRAICCASGQQALSALDGILIPDLILLDTHMPDLDGFAVLRQLKASAAYRNVPVVFLTGDGDVKTESAGLSAGAADFIRKPFAPQVLLKRVRNLVELNRLHNDMAQAIRSNTEKLSRAYLQVVEALAAAVDAKDPYTHGHSARVAVYAREIARRAGFRTSEQDQIYISALLHDVGKIGVHDAIIDKPSRLTDGEYAEIKTHPTVGWNILRKITDLPELMVGARWHHERYDGKGYPDGLAGEDIPEAARIIAVADTYDAMTSNRSYRSTLPQDQVRRELERSRGSQLDPRFCDIMLAMMDEDRDYRMREGAVCGRNHV